MKVNEANYDRIIRVILGLVLIYLGFFGSWHWVFGVLGIIPLVTGMVGFCPLYALLKTGTQK